MGEHKTIGSLAFINFLKVLGIELGYYVDLEYPMSSQKYGSQAIDIAWFNDEFSEFPLMIFEIESSTNNSIINNPAKVFGKDSSIFEKPLFFFHIIIESAVNSEKYNDLVGLFGKHNYDLFRINNGEMTKLITKILCQHRRVCKEIAIESLLYHILKEELILSNIDLTSLLISIESVCHLQQKYDIGQIYANITSVNPNFFNQYIDFLERKQKSKDFNELNYDGYIPSIIARLINISLLINNSKGALNYSKQIEDYQNQTGSFKMIDFLPGLNRDYDEFILDYVSYYLVLCFVLCDKELEAQKYIASVILDLIEKMKRSASIIEYHHVSWALLVFSTKQQYLKEYDVLKELINNEGGMPDLILYNPLCMNSYNESQYFRENNKMVLVPEITDYKVMMCKSFSSEKNCDINELAIKSISKNWIDNKDFYYDLGMDLNFYIVSHFF